VSDKQNIATVSDSDRAIVEGDPNAEVAAKREKEEKDEFVRRQAYEEVSKDMHKFKERFRDAEARAAEYEAKLRSIEEQKLKDEQRYQELYEREKTERERAEEARQQERNLYLRAVKLSALKAELGNIKDQYLSHADIDSIEVKEDGTLSSESVHAVANRFREEHPMLIPQESGGNITNYASPTSFNSASGNKSLSEMSYEEKANYLKQLKNK
jgi:predicted RNase H-like nuclease (RuvC/YqgF family)